MEHTARKQNARYLPQAIEFDAGADHVPHRHKQGELVASQSKGCFCFVHCTGSVNDHVSA